MMADAGFRSLVVPFMPITLRPSRPTLLLLQSGVLTLLLIGTVNLGNLLLVRAGRPSQGIGGAAGAGCRAGKHMVSEVLVETTLAYCCAEVLVYHSLRCEFIF